MDVTVKKSTVDNEFSCELFKKILQTENDKNIVLAPIGVKIALSMLSRFVSDLPDDFKISIPMNELRSKSCKIATGLWINTSNNNFGIEIKKDDNIFSFKKYDKSTIEQINKWVEKQTNGKIDKILDENSELLPIIAVNVIYFFEKWIHEFTHEGEMDFHTENGIVSTHFMSLTYCFNFISKDDYTVIEIPYENKRYSMFIIVPKNLDKVLNNLLNIINEIKKSHEKILKLYLPKFEMDDTHSNLTEHIKIPDKLKGYLEIAQKTCIKMDEKGTEAAAATRAQLRGGGGLFNIDTFKVDKPFIFVLYDKQEDLILFIGYIRDPSNQTISMRQNTTSSY